MKLKNLLNLVMVLMAGQLMFACSSAKYYEFSPNKPEAYNTVKQKPASAQVTSPSLTELAVAAAEDKATAKEAEPTLEANAVTKPTVLPKKPTAIAKVPVASAASPDANLNDKVAITEEEALAMAKERLANMTKAEKKELKKELKEAIKYQSGGTRTSVVEIILAILLPPLAVFLHDGIGSSFWINILLTLLFFLPGVIHALLVVTDTI